MMKRLTIGISLGMGIFMLGCTTANMRLHDLSVDTQRREALFAANPRYKEAKTGRVFRVKQDMIVTHASAPGMYNTTAGFSGCPISKEEYYAKPRKWRWIVGYIEAGTRIRGVRLEWYEPEPLSSDLGWLGIVYEILDGAHAGKLLTPQPPLFLLMDALSPDPEFLEEVPVAEK